MGSGGVGPGGGKLGIAACEGVVIGLSPRLELVIARVDADEHAPP